MTPGFPAPRSPGHRGVASFPIGTGASSDTSPLTVALTVPTAGATVATAVTVSADASDDVAVAGVQFHLDGANLGAEDNADRVVNALDLRLVSANFGKTVA